MCPRFSVIIPTYKRPEQLSQCLQAIAQLDFPKDRFEVLVVSDEVNPATAALVEKYSRGAGWRAIMQDHAGPARARNAGAEAASGDFLLFLDDDCAPVPEWLRRWEEHVARHPDSAAAGGTTNAFAANLYSSASHALLEFVTQYFHPRSAGRIPFLASNNLCVPARRFREMGGFSPVFMGAGAEDRDFCDRWHARGWTFSHAEEARVLHRHRLTLWTFWRQHFHYGEGAYLLHRERRSRNQVSGVEPVHFYAGLLRSAHPETGAWKSAAISALLVVAQLANLAGYLAARTGVRWNRPQIAPSSFPDRLRDI